MSAFGWKPARNIVTHYNLATPWSRFAVMNCDWESGHPEKGDGLLTREKLLAYIEKLQQERAEEYHRGDSTIYTDIWLRDARGILRDMEGVNADAVDYLPEQLKDFPGYLRSRAAELLMRDDPEAIGEISQLVIDNSRSRYRMIEDTRRRERALEEIDELARKLGLY